MSKDYFKSRDVLKVGKKDYSIYRLDALEKAGLTKLNRLPFSIRIMLEAALRQCNDREITQQDVKNIAGWTPSPSAEPGGSRPGIPFLPARVIMQDFTGVPAVVDLAAMRVAVARLGGDPKKINPLVPVDLVIDHSVQVDFFANPDALKRNEEMEFQRNRERYEFLKWGQKAFDNFRVVPPATGIVHQVNLEYLAQVVLSKKEGLGASEVLLPRYADRHRLAHHDDQRPGGGRLGGGGHRSGSRHARAADGHAASRRGRLQTPRQTPGGHHRDRPGADRDADPAKKGVVDKIVEFYGAGLDSMTLPDRATIANMSPEYGATMGFFPVDIETLRYMKMTGRPAEVIERTEAYCREQGLFRETGTPEAPIPTCWNWTWAAWCHPWQDQNAPRTGWR